MPDTQGLPNQPSPAATRCELAAGREPSQSSGTAREFSNPAIAQIRAPSIFQIHRSLRVEAWPFSREETHSCTDDYGAVSVAGETVRG